MPRVGRQCRIGQVDEDPLTWTDRTVADHLRTSIADDHLSSRRVEEMRASHAAGKPIAHAQNIPTDPSRP
jgi:hypothetical protein